MTHKREVQGELKPDPDAEWLQLERDGFVHIPHALSAQLADSVASLSSAMLDDVIDAVKVGTLEVEEAFGAAAPPAKPVAFRWNLLLDLPDVNGDVCGDTENSIMDAAAARIGSSTGCVRAAIGEVVKRTANVFERACGADAVLCDLSVLISDPGSAEQRLHFDTRFSDSENSSELEETGDDNDNDHDEGREDGRAKKMETGDGTVARDETVLEQLLPVKLRKRRNLRSRRTAEQRQKRLLTAFVALQDVSVEMGPTAVVARTANAETHSLVHTATCEGAEHVERVLAGFERSRTLCVLAKGDVVLMDSRALHQGTANISALRRQLLDFAFVGRRHATPSTYCECIKSSVRDKHYLRDFRVERADRSPVAEKEQISRR